MASESGDMKLLGNFSKLLELIQIDPDYKPVNAGLKVPTLNTQHSAALASIGEIGAFQAPYKAAVNDRQEVYNGLPALVSRAGNMLKASGAGESIQNDAKTFARKISGRRKSPKVKDDPNTPENEATESHSVSQRSYENMLGNFENYIAVLSTVGTYKPNEPDLKISGLTALANDLRAKNEAVNAAFAPVSAARGQRDRLLYLDEDCVVNTALLVKAYVRAAFGQDSQLFKSIKGLKFKRRGQ